MSNPIYECDTCRQQIEITVNDTDIQLLNKPKRQIILGVMWIISRVVFYTNTTNYYRRKYGL